MTIAAILSDQEPDVGLRVEAGKTELQYLGAMF